MLAPVAAAADPVRIHDIQGSTRVSELLGRQVSDVPGVVTGVRSFGSSRGFWFQDSEPDADPRTSEGTFVYTGEETPQVTSGDKVSVSAKVAEYYPVSDGDTPETTPNQSVTELTEAEWPVSSARPTSTRARPRSW